MRGCFGLALLLLALAPDAVRAGPPLVPPQLIAACHKLANGAPCSAHFEDKTVQGVCRPLPDHQLACLPAGGTKPRHPAKP